MTTETPTRYEIQARDSYGQYSAENVGNEPRANYFATIEDAELVIAQMRQLPDPEWAEADYRVQERDYVADYEQWLMDDDGRAKLQAEVAA